MINHKRVILLGLLFPIISGAAVSLCGNSIFNQTSYAKNKFRAETSISTSFADTLKILASPINGSLELRASPRNNLTFSTTCNFRGDFIGSSNEATMVNIVCNGTFLYEHSSKRKTAIGAGISIPLNSNDEFGAPRNSLFTNHSTFASLLPALGIIIGDHSSSLQWQVLFQPEIALDQTEETVFHSSMIFQFLPSRTISPLIVVSTSVASNDLIKHNPQDSLSLRVSPSILFSFSKHIDIRTDFTFGLGDKNQFIQNYKYNVDPNFEFGFSIGFNFSSKNKSTKTKIEDELTTQKETPLFYGMNNYSYMVSQPDQDIDGIPDSLDSCPSQKELFNGFEDLNGCPETVSIRPISAVEMTTILENVTFKTESVELSSTSINGLTPIINRLLQDTNSILMLHSYTDDSGNYDTNFDFSQQRIIAILEYLTLQGINNERILLLAHGPNDPIADNSTAKGRELNRRIEFEFINNE